MQQKNNNSPYSVRCSYVIITQWTFAAESNKLLALRCENGEINLLEILGNAPVATRCTKNVTADRESYQRSQWKRSLYQNVRLVIAKKNGLRVSFSTCREKKDET